MGESNTAKELLAGTETLVEEELTKLFEVLNFPKAATKAQTSPFAVLFSEMETMNEKTDALCTHWVT